MKEEEMEENNPIVQLDEDLDKSDDDEESTTEEK